VIAVFYHINLIKQAVQGYFNHLAPRLATVEMTLVAFVQMMPGAYVMRKAWALFSYSGLQDTKNNSKA
jgi:hypothetical protein